MIKCIVCNREADFVFQGNSYCEEHIEQAKINSQKMQEGMGKLFLNLQSKMMESR
jgi:uncharacterized protein CbrC (UPF0167 family)